MTQSLGKRKSRWGDTKNSDGDRRGIGGGEGGRRGQKEKVKQYHTELGKRKSRWGDTKNSEGDRRRGNRKKEEQGKEDDKQKEQEENEDKRKVKQHTAQLEKEEK